MWQVTVELLLFDDVPTRQDVIEWISLAGELELEIYRDYIGTFCGDFAIVAVIDRYAVLASTDEYIEDQDTPERLWNGRPLNRNMSRERGAELIFPPARVCGWNRCRPTDKRLAQHVRREAPRERQWSGRCRRY